VAGTLLPDLLRYDPTRPASYPHNGRKPSDDAADAFLALITNGKVKGDGAGPHGDLLAEFPYLGRLTKLHDKNGQIFVPLNWDGGGNQEPPL
jgi:hypothetical protein